MELEIKHLKKRFGAAAAVDDVSCTMHHGVYGLLGVNGAGKTTLMRMLCTLVHPTAGEITYNGRDIFEMDAQYRNLLGYLPQEFGFYPDFTVEEYLSYISAIKGLRPAVAGKRTRELLRQMGLSEVRKKKMKKLSGGMKRRVGIAQAILNDPEILILDEPTVGLDPNERIRFRNLISELAHERLVLLSTHIVSDVEYIADQILLMKDGRLMHSGTSEEIVAAMEERVWNCVVSHKEASECMRRYKVANVKPAQEQLMLRILSAEKPMADAVELEPTLEDAFLYYFGSPAQEFAKGGEHHGLL